jgi:sulfoxide reductase heme-binding subunit YedZ
MKVFYKPAVFVLSLIPAVMLVYYGFTSQLTANPIEFITHYTGDWAIYFLLITLSVTPLRTITNASSLIQYRRMLGLFAFFYACLHVTTYFVLDQFFDLQAILDDIIERPYITVGFTAFVLLLPLAVTSTRKMVMRLGNRWRQLHKLIYPITCLAILHYLWLVKADTRTPLTLALIFAVLMLLRMRWVRQARNRLFSQG